VANPVGQTNGQTGAEEKDDGRQQMILKVVDADGPKLPPGWGQTRGSPVPYADPS
jgi:hypothetical protein